MQTVKELIIKLLETDDLNSVIVAEINVDNIKQNTYKYISGDIESYDPKSKTIILKELS